jgi:hypothetical protein
MPKTMSAKQLAANRRNARQSTGPRTPTGKAVSKMNALKHGVLARSVVVHGYKFKESVPAFQKLCLEFCANLAPEGPLEEMLVNQIVTIVWRLRRARTAESGEIALSVDAAYETCENRDPVSISLFLGAALMSPYSTEFASKLKCSSLGISYLISGLDEVLKCVEQDGELTEATLTDFKDQLCRDRNGMVNKLEDFRAWLVANPGKLKPKALRARHKKEVQNYLKREIETLDFQWKKRKEQEAANERAEKSAAVLPSAEVLDKILRYETTLGRQLFRAMNQLERLQRRRQGENVPPPLAMEVSARA